MSIQINIHAHRDGSMSVAIGRVEHLDPYVVLDLDGGAVSVFLGVAELDRLAEVVAEGQQLLKAPGVTRSLGTNRGVAIPPGMRFVPDVFADSAPNNDRNPSRRRQVRCDRLWESQFPRHGAADR